jgi:hypothetical protein
MLGISKNAGHLRVAQSLLFSLRLERIGQSSLSQGLI